MRYISGNSCDADGTLLYQLSCSPGITICVEREGLLPGQQLVFLKLCLGYRSLLWVFFPPSLPPRPNPGEVTPASPQGVDTTRGAAVTGYKPLLNWRRARRQGSFQTVGEIAMSH